MNDKQQIQSQIGVSIALARNLVASWLPPLTESEKKTEAENAKSQSTLIDSRRRPGAGLGSTAEKDDSAQLSLEELKLKRRLMQKDKKLKEHARDLQTQKSAKRHKSLTQDVNGDSDSDEEESNSRRKGQKKLKSTTNIINNHVARGEKKAAKEVRGFGR